MATVLQFAPVVTALLLTPVATELQPANDPVLLQLTQQGQVLQLSSVAVRTYPIASQAEAVAGVDASKSMTPLRTGQAITDFAWLAEGIGATRARSSAARAAEVFNALDFVAGDGATNDAPAINALFTAAAAAGKPVHFQPGAYRLLSRLQCPSGLRVVAARRATFVKEFATTGSLAGIGQASYAAKVSDIRWTGGHITVPDNTGNLYRGDIFGFYGDEIALEDFVIDTFGGTSGGRAVIINGDRNRINNPFVIRPNPGVGNGGIRVTGGDGFLCIGGYVEAGDDVFQFVPTIVGPNALNDNDITNGMFIGCVGRSYSARLLIAGVGNQTSEVGDVGKPPCTASIRDCSFIGIKGVGEGKAALIFNTDSTGKVTRLTISHTTLGGDVDATLDGAMTILGWRCGGGIDGVDLVGTSIVTPSKIALLVDGAHIGGGLPEIRPQNVRNISWVGGRIEAPDNESSFAVKLLGVKGIAFRDVGIAASGNEAIQAGSGVDLVNLVSNLTIDGGAIENIADAQYGVKFQIADSGLVVGTRFVGADGGIDSRAVFFGPDLSEACTVRDCDLSALTGAALFGNVNANGHVVENCRGYSGAQELYVARKTADQAKVNDATLANDAELVLTGLAASSTYMVEAFLNWNQGAVAAGGIQFAMPITGGGGADWQWTSAPGLAAARNVSATAVSSTAANERISTFRGLLRTGNADIDLALQWAQATVNAQATTLEEHSVLYARKVE